jgi:AcrR family transcriptional regulator
MAVRTRQRLIDAAKRRFYRDGFRNVGIDAILTEVGISKAAFYKHFESKDDLMVAVLDDVDRFLQQQFREMVRQRGGRSAEGQLRAILDVVQQVIESEDFHGCIFVNAAIEFPLPNDPAHKAAVRHKRGLEDFYYELGERAAVADPAGLAQELGMIIEGAYITRAVTGESASMGIARRLVDQMFHRHLPDQRPRRARSPASLKSHL